jgi:signal transduction histidine kinase
VRRVRAGVWLAVSITAVALVAQAVVVTVAGNSGERWAVLLALVIGAGSNALGFLVIRREPANVTGLLLSALGGAYALTTLVDVYGAAREHRSGGVPQLPDSVPALFMTLWVWLYTVILLLVLFFPNGRLPSSRWRWVVGAVVTVAFAIELLMPVLPGPYAPPFDAVNHPFGVVSESLGQVLSAVLFPLFVLLGILCLAAAWTRYRRGDAKLRAQLKWFALAVVVGVPCIVGLSWVGYWVLGTHDLAGIGFSLVAASLPVATAVAIFRHDLYDIDRALSVTITSVAALGGLGIVFGLATFAAGFVVGQGSRTAAAAVTAVVGLAGIPLFGSLRRMVDRWVYPLRFDTLKAITDLRTGIDAGHAAPEQLEDVLRVALHDDRLQVGYREPGADAFVDVNGRQLVSRPDALAVTLAGRNVGVLQPCATVPQPLLREVAEWSATLVELVRLRLAANRARHDAEASRARLQRVGYDERRRLERDLHDGAQQRLVSLGMALRFVQRHLDDGSIDVSGMLEESMAELGGAVADLRRLAQGIRPSCLDDGLHPALSYLIGSMPASTPVELVVDAGNDLPDDVATTVYFVVAEALANVVKHAGAQQIRVEAVRNDDVLVVRVEDDGCGGAVAHPGSGLAGLGDRVLAGSGRIDLVSPPGQGTVLEVLLPCGL